MQFSYIIITIIIIIRQELSASLCAHRQAGLNFRTDSIKGTPWFMAPEVIQSNTHDYGCVRHPCSDYTLFHLLIIYFIRSCVPSFLTAGRESDIWSFGCTIWQMAMGRPPFVEIREVE